MFLIEKDFTEIAVTRMRKLEMAEKSVSCH